MSFPSAEAFKPGIQPGFRGPDQRPSSTSGGAEESASTSGHWRSQTSRCPSPGRSPSARRRCGPGTSVRRQGCTISSSALGALSSASAEVCMTRHRLGFLHPTWRGSPRPSGFVSGGVEKSPRPGASPAREHPQDQPPPWRRHEARRPTCRTRRTGLARATRPAQRCVASGRQQARRLSRGRAAVPGLLTDTSLTPAATAASWPHCPRILDDGVPGRKITGRPRGSPPSQYSTSRPSGSTHRRRDRLRPSREGMRPRPH